MTEITETTLTTSKHLIGGAKVAILTTLAGRIASALLVVALCAPLVATDPPLIAVVPVTIGQGTPLFKPNAGKRHYALIAARPLENGTVILHYGVKPEA